MEDNRLLSQHNLKYPHKKTLITCHANADFDALCALLGISLLFPNAQLVFPGTQEKVLQEFYDDIVLPLFACISPKDADFEDVERLVVVDTQNISRLTHIKALISKKNLEVLIWDHHSSATLKADGGVQALVGASCTLIAEELRNIFSEIPCVFASFLGIGIYQDTGAFTFSSTTARDYMAAAWLLENEFLPEIVTPYITRNLSREQFYLLNSLVDSAQIIDALGLRFIIASARSEVYINDLAMLVSPFLDMNPCQVLFIVVDMGEGVQIIGRSKDESFDVAKICNVLGGGGHAYAASVMVKDMILPEIITFLETQISIFAHKDKIARRLMSAPVVSAFTDNTMREAEQIMGHYRLKAIPILRSNTKICAGILEHEVALRAVGHGLGSILVSAYMQRNFSVVTEETNLQCLMDIIIGDGQRLVPVIYEIKQTDQIEQKKACSQLSAKVQNTSFHKNEFLKRIEEENESLSGMEETPVIGVITRTDLIRLFLDNDEIQLPKPKTESVRKRNLLKMIRMYTPEPCIQLLEIAGHIASNAKLNLYVVGGFVRDLLMKQQEFRWPNMDIDLVVEGDAIAYAHDLALVLNGRVREHKEFLTALVIFDSTSICMAYEAMQAQENNSAQLHKKNQYSKKQGLEEGYEIRIDIATARLEYYESPAALPTVELSSIRMDLARRDFTINAMAIQLNKEYFGKLVDFFDGQSDIKNKRVRMLHSLSFIEDPTRALRAVRFEQRYNFKIGQHCDKLIRNAVELGLIQKLSEKRIASELSIILFERDWLFCLLRLQDFNILSSIHPALEIANKDKISFMENCNKALIWYDRLYLEEQVDVMLLFVLANSRAISYDEFKSLLERLAFTPSKVQEILGLRSEIIHAAISLDKWKETQMSMSDLHEILQAIPIEGLLFLSARKPVVDIDEKTEALYRCLSQYIYQYRHLKLEIRGEDLIQMGVSQGPQIGFILKEVLKAKMDEIVTGYEEEWLYAKNLLDNMF